MTPSTDTLFKTPGAYPTPFEFNEHVASVFDDMLVRSIPGYESMLYLCTRLVHKVEQDRSDIRIYDLGCSTAKFFRLLLRFTQKGEWIGIDASLPMIEQAQRYNLPSFIRLSCDDILTYAYSSSDIFLLNYVMQFIEPSRRLSLLINIRQSLRPGGCLVLSEKLAIRPGPFKDWIQAEYDSYKQRNGYEKIEIERKKEALHNVLLSTTEQDLRTLVIDEAGFRNMECIQRHLQFATYIIS